MNSSNPSEKTKNALSIVISESVPEAHRVRIKGAAGRVGVNVAISTTVQETVELAAFSPRILVVCASLTREDLVHEVTICKLLAKRITSGSARVFLLLAADMKKLATSVSRYGFHEIGSTDDWQTEEHWVTRLTDAMKVLSGEEDLRLETEGALAPLVLPAKSPPEKTDAQTVRVRHTAPLNHDADFWVSPRIRGTEPQKVATKWRVALKGPPPSLGGWYQIPAPLSCHKPPHDQEAGWWEWRFRKEPVAGAGPGFDPEEFLQSRFRWVTHGTEPWMHNGLWRFSGSFPLLALLEGFGTDATLVGLRFIARSEMLMDITYDSGRAPLIEPRLDAAIEEGSEDVMRVRPVSPDKMRPAQPQRPDARQFLSQLSPSFSPATATPSPGTSEIVDIEDLPQNAIGPVQHIRKHGELSEFELRWLFSEWLIEAGEGLGDTRSSDLTLAAQRAVARKLFEFAAEIVEAANPEFLLEIWQESEAGLDHLTRVDPLLYGDPAVTETRRLDLSFAALSALPGITCHSHRAQRGSSDSFRPLGAALVVRHSQGTPPGSQSPNPQLEPAATRVLERIVEFLSRTLPQLTSALPNALKQAG